MCRNELMCVAGKACSHVDVFPMSVREEPISNGLQISFYRPCSDITLNKIHEQIAKSFCIVVYFLHVRGKQTNN